MVQVARVIERDWELYTWYAGIAGLSINMLFFGIAYLGNGFAGVVWLANSWLTISLINGFFLGSLIVEPLRQPATRGGDVLRVRSQSGRWFSLSVRDIDTINKNVLRIRVHLKDGRALSLYPWLLREVDWLAGDAVKGDAAESL